MDFWVDLAVFSSAGWLCHELSDIQHFPLISNHAHTVTFHMAPVVYKVSFWISRNPTSSESILNAPNDWSEILKEKKRMLVFSCFALSQIIHV